MKLLKYFPWVVGALAVAIVGTSLVAPFLSGPAVSNGGAVSKVNDPAVVVARYQSGIQQIKQSLLPLLDRELKSEDGAAVRAIHQAALQLSVPKNEQQFHMKLVLALSRLADLLEPKRVALAATGKTPTVIGTQAELKTLVASPTPE